MKMASSISLKSPEELSVLREGGKILAEVVQELRRSLKSGMTTSHWFFPTDITYFGHFLLLLNTF